MNAVCIIKQIFHQYVDVLFFLQKDLILFDFLDMGISVELLTCTLIINSDSI